LSSEPAVAMTRAPKRRAIWTPTTHDPEQQDVRSSFKDHPPFPPLTNQHPANPSAN
jgi:hypothetical protein